MNTEICDIFIIGAGAAGMGAAIAAKAAGDGKVIVAERDSRTGGVLNQCIHHGFGLSYFREDLTGMAYADRVGSVFRQCGAILMKDTMVTQLNPDRSAVVSSFGSLKKICFSECIVATGCRERTIQSLGVAGTRPAGIFTAGTVQKAINVCHYDIDDPVIVLGTGDIGQVVARQLVMSGKKVLCMIEQNSTPGGMARNRRECIDACKIPVITDSTITKIYGEKRISGVEITNLRTGKKTFESCTTLITALGLIPERELIAERFFENGLPEWIRLVGNCDYVHDIVDRVSVEAEKAGGKAYASSQNTR